MTVPYREMVGTTQILEDGCFNYLTWISSLPRFERQVQPDVTLISADSPVMYFNSATEASFQGDAGERIRQIKDYFAGQGRSFTWLVTPSCRPKELGQRILQQGGELLEAIPYMLLHLDQIQRSLPVHPGFRAEPVRTPAMLYAWTSIYCQARAYRHDTDRLFSILSDLPLDEGSPLQLLLGYLEDWPVATYSVFLDREIAGFYSLSTLPEARGRGVGTSISIAAADLAQAYGYEAAMLLSEPMSRSLCKRLGFVEGFGSMDVYRMSI